MNNVILLCFICVSLAQSDTITVTLNATKGTITLSQTTGLTFSVGSGTLDQTMTFSGTIANCNAAMQNLQYRPYDVGNFKDDINVTIKRTPNDTLRTSTQNGQLTFIKNLGTNLRADIVEHNDQPYLHILEDVIIIQRLGFSTRKPKPIPKYRDLVYVK